MLQQKQQIKTVTKNRLVASRQIEQIIQGHLSQLRKRDKHHVRPNPKLSQ